MITPAEHSTPFDVIGVDRADEIRARLAELAKMERRFKASRRRFRLRAFLQWQQLARQRHRRNDSERSESLAGAPP